MQVLSKKSDKIFFDLAALCVLLILVVLPFIEPLSHGKTLSKLSLICDIDLAQDATKSFAIHADPSQATTHTPNEIFADTPAELPLWNNLNGGGRPLIGDFQTLVFSFFHSCFPSKNHLLVSLGIIFKLFLAAAGSYFMARALGISRIVSIAVGQAFALSPHCLSFVELCGNFCFYPWLILAALWCFSRIAPARIVLLGLLCGASAYNMHPETFVCGVAAALLFASARFAFSWKKSEFFPQLRTLLLCLISVSIVAFLVAAPLVLPFCEFIANGVSYKFADTHLEYIDLFTFTSNLIAPFSAESTFIGLVLASCIPLGLLCSWRKQPVLPMALLASILFTTRPGPLEAWLGQRPLSYLLPEYTSYFCILFAAIAGGIGLDVLLKASLQQRRQCFYLILLPAAALALAFVLNNNTFGERWSELTSFGFTGNAQIFPAAEMIAQTLLVFSLLCIALSSQVKLQSWSTQLSVLLVLFNCLALWRAVGRELPAGEPFWYRRSEIVRLLQERLQPLSFRSTATGDHLLQPNTNLIFGYDDFRCTAPLHPRRYADFADACGIKSRNCNIYASPYELNNLYDLASVNLIASDAPVHSADPELRQIEMGKALDFDYKGAAIKIRPGLRLDQAAFAYYPKSHEIEGSALLTVHMSGRFSYYFQWLLLDDNEKTFWHSSWQASTIEQSGQLSGNHHYQIKMIAPIPTRLSSKSVRVLLKIRSGSSIESPNWHDRSLVLSKIKLQESGDSTPGRILRVAETDAGLQLYENRRALPLAYMVHQIRSVANPKDSLALLQDKTLDWHKLATIECKDRLASPSLALNADMVRILDRDANAVSLLVVSDAPGYLVLTDTFYPGWTVYVDDKPDTIYPANYAFRAVYLPAGKHHVLFVYDPQSFAWGLRFLYLGLSISTMILLWQAALALKETRQTPRNATAAGENYLTETMRAKSQLDQKPAEKLRLGPAQDADN